MPLLRSKQSGPGPPAVQTIHLGRREKNSIEFEHPEVRVPLAGGEESSLELRLVNHGEPAHVHLSAGEGLKNAAIFLKDNPYVKGEERVAVLLRVPKGAPVPLRGEILVTAGYGAQKKGFRLLLGEATPGPPPPVKPEPEAPEPSAPAISGRTPEVPEEPPAPVVAPARPGSAWGLWAAGGSLALFFLLASTLLVGRGEPPASFVLALGGVVLLFLLLLFGLRHLSPARKS
ncbi:MAG: hypothetical protein HY558_00850 [Euryarchaeota archaeon]|nr:hypothetical protein [Euryarchaeota archaeon]